jgi:hypothetical protein
MTLSLSSKAALVSLLLSYLFPFLFTFSVEEAASCRRTVKVIIQA